MVMLYSVHLGRSVDGFGKPSVHALPITEGLTGHYDSERSAIVKPDKAAVREALPHYWRKAFDRGAWWFPNTGNTAAYLHLHDRKGKYRNTVYAIPYNFNP